MQYPVESFTEAERERLRPHFTNLDRPVFALVNLPETVKAALFARYSRYPGTLRRLFLDEFAGDLPDAAALVDQGEGRRAAELYERIFLGYGDDSVAQLGGAHVACEWVSNVLTKILQRPRLAGYLEQSTRYIAYDAPMPTDAARRLPLLPRRVARPRLRARHGRAVRDLLGLAPAGLRVGRAGVPAGRPTSPTPRTPARSRPRRSICCAGCCPASSLSHMGIFATGQSYEQLILHLLAHPLEEARTYGRMILEELQHRDAELPHPRRAPRSRWPVDQLSRVARARRRAVGEAARASTAAGEAPAGPSVTLLRVDGDEDDLLSALLFEAGASSEEHVREAIATLDTDTRAELLADLAGERANRRYRPGRGLETLRYRFEIVADYGAFRDLQRHRMLTVQWQSLTPDLGADVPEQVELAGVRR